MSATAVVALAIGIGIGRSVLTTASHSPSAMPSVAVGAASSRPSSQPVSTPSVTPSELAPGGTLEWTAGQPLPAVAIRDVAVWGGNYLAIAIRGNAPAFLSSRDGAHWAVLTVASKVKIQAPRFLRALPDRLLEIGEQPEAACPTAAVAPCVEGAPQILVSMDGGASWTEPASSSWSTLFTSAELIDVAEGPGGLVAIGMGHGAAPVVAHSTDGVTWQPTTRSAFPDAIFRDVMASRRGFAILGREGTQDTGSGGVGQPGTGVPAAWWSLDGETWSRSTVQGPSGTGAELSWGLAGTDGLFALGRNLDPGAVGAAGWTSQDGSQWIRAGQVTKEIPYGTEKASNGKEMFILGPARVFAPTDESLAAWVSTDGRGWSAVEMAGDKNQLPAGGPSPTSGAVMDSVFAVFLPGEAV